ncbi:hypothetical protein SUDANB105_02436 [Streptomyces sp. enrichment culture]
MTHRCQLVCPHRGQNTFLEVTKMTKEEAEAQKVRQCGSYKS